MSRFPEGEEPFRPGLERVHDLAHRRALQTDRRQLPPPIGFEETDEDVKPAVHPGDGAGDEEPRGDLPGDLQHTGGVAGLLGRDPVVGEHREGRLTGENRVAPRVEEGPRARADHLLDRFPGARVEVRGVTNVERKHRHKLRPCRQHHEKDLQQCDRQADSHSASGGQHQP